MTDYKPNKNNIDIVEAEIVRLANRCKDLGIALEDFFGGVVNGANSVLVAAVPSTDSRRERVIRTAMVIGIKEGARGDSHGNAQRVH